MGAGRVLEQQYADGLLPAQRVGPAVGAAQGGAAAPPGAPLLRGGRARARGRAPGLARAWRQRRRCCGRRLSSRRSIGGESRPSVGALRRAVLRQLPRLGRSPRHAPVQQGPGAAGVVRARPGGGLWRRAQRHLPRGWRQRRPQGLQHRARRAVPRLARAARRGKLHFVLKGEEPSPQRARCIPRAASPQRPAS